MYTGKQDKNTFFQSTCKHTRIVYKYFIFQVYLHTHKPTTQFYLGEITLQQFSIYFYVPERMRKVY